MPPFFAAVEPTVGDGARTTDGLPLLAGVAARGGEGDLGGDGERGFTERVPPSEDALVGGSGDKVFRSGDGLRARLGPTTEALAALALAAPE